MDLLISGSTAYDRIMDFPGKFSDHILPNKIHTLNVSFGLTTLNIQYGGTAGNITYNLGLLREKSYLISQVGNDFKNYKAWLLEHHVNLRYVRVLKQSLSATAHIITDQADNQITGFYFGAMGTAALKDKSILQRITRQVTTRPCWALLAAGNVDDMLTLAKLYQRKGVPYIFDPGQQTVWLTAEQIKTIVRGATMLIVNDYELALIEKKLATTKQKLMQQLDRLIVTLGEHGAEWHVAGKKFIMPIAKPKQVVDPTGAGDAYRAGLLKGLVEDWDVETTGRVAALCATYAIEHYGTQRHNYSPKQFQDRFYKVFKRKITL